MMKWIYLVIGGITGTLARYLLAGSVHRFLGTSFPLGTLVVNLIGCFLIGLFATLADQKFLLGPDLRILLMVGFCGAFTTFSTFMLETVNLMSAGEFLKATFNVAGSVVIGFVAFRLGVLAAQFI
jgi:CrcB protein